MRASRAALRTQSNKWKHHNLPLNANGNLAPTKILGGSATTITFPAGLAVDFEGRIYVADEGPDGGGPGSILVFGAGAAGNVRHCP